MVRQGVERRWSLYLRNEIAKQELQTELGPWEVRLEVRSLFGLMPLATREYY